MTSKSTRKQAVKQPPRRPQNAPSGTAASVDDYVASIEGPARQAVLALREIILAADPSIAEGIKWNVPSFRTSDWFATMHLRLKSGIGLILHFGAKKSVVSTTGVAIADPSSMLVWLAKDRAMVTFRDAEDIRARASELTALVREWIRQR